MTWRKAVLWTAIVLFVQIAAYVAVFQDQFEDIDQARYERSRLMDAYLGKKRQAVNLDLHRQQLRMIDEMFGVLLKALPNQFDRDFGSLVSAAKARGLQVEDLRPDEREVWREFYAELSARIKITGRYHALAAFTADLAEVPGSVLLKDFQLTPSVTPGLLSMEATFRTFRYLDDDEVAAARKAAKARKGQAKK